MSDEKQNIEIFKLISIGMMMMAFILPTGLSYIYLSMTREYGGMISDSLRQWTEAFSMAYTFYIYAIACSIVVFVGILLRRRFTRDASLEE